MRWTVVGWSSGLQADFPLIFFDENIFQNCIEQLFDGQFVRVARNNEFGEEFLFNIKVIFQSLDTRMSKYYKQFPIIL